MTDLINDAKAFAFAAHNAIGQTRKYTQDPYTTHLERVAQLVQSVVDDEHMVAAAYLHDVVEDTSTTLDEVKARFGHEVGYLVEYLTDVSKPEDGNRAVRKQIDRDHIAEGDARVHTVKLADLIDNSESITAHDPRFARVYMQEKAQLLEVLSDGHAALLARARQIVADWQASA